MLLGTQRKIEMGLPIGLPEYMLWKCPEDLCQSVCRHAHLMYGVLGLPDTLLV